PGAVHRGGVHQTPGASAVAHAPEHPPRGWIQPDRTVAAVSGAVFPRFGDQGAIHKGEVPVAAAVMVAERPRRSEIWLHGSQRVEPVPGADVRLMPEEAAEL